MRGNKYKKYNILGKKMRKKRKEWGHFYCSNDYKGFDMHENQNSLSDASQGLIFYNKQLEFL